MISRREESLRGGRFKSGLKNLARTSLVGLTAAAVAFPMAMPASANPLPTKPKTVAEATALVDDLKAQSSALDQKWVESKEKYASAEKALATKQAEVEKQQTKLSELRRSVALIALSDYQTRGIDNTTKLMVTSSPEELLRDLSVTERVTASQRTTLQSYQTNAANLADMERAAETDVATMKAATEEMAATRKQADEKLAEAQKILNQLTAEERARLEAERRAAEQRAAAAAAAAAAQTAPRTTTPSRTTPRTTTTQPKTSPAPTTPPPAVPASGRGAAALNFAISKIGSPYVYGGTGPGYDCSGLTQAAYRAAGVSIPRTTWAQWGGTTPISRSQLQPGDLVFFYNLGHVGIYAGNGTVVHAPYTGSRVRYEAMSNMPVVGYRRV